MYGLCHTRTPTLEHRYKQYEKYVEKAMVVKDDNVEGIGALRQKVSFPDTSLLDPTQQHLVWPGTHTQGVGYTLSIDANDETTRPPSVQTWYRQIKVIPVNECVDKTIPKQFQSRCHEFASCIDTKSSYECECFEGFDCDDCDGHLDGTGCVDMNPPTIELSGDWISYVRDVLIVLFVTCTNTRTHKHTHTHTTGTRMQLR